MRSEIVMECNVKMTHFLKVFNFMDQIEQHIKYNIKYTKHTPEYSDLCDLINIYLKAKEEVLMVGKIKEISKINP